MAIAHVFTVGVILLIVDFFRYAPRFEIMTEPDSTPNRKIAPA
jgi:hypothetical protein